MWFLSSSATFASTRRSLLPYPLRHTLRLPCRKLTSVPTKLDSKGRAISYEPPSQYWGTDESKTFNEVGIRLNVLPALKKAFPQITSPTETQQRLIPAVYSGKDVFLKDHTGTGKTFALLLALLCKPRQMYNRQGSDPSQRGKAPAITSLFIVPHRDLAYQIFEWAKRLHAHMPKAEPLPSLVQVIARNAATPLAGQIAQLRASPPHILLGTPQALLDVLEEDKGALKLHTLSTVVVDEVDYLIESMPRATNNKGNRYARLKVERQMRRHPSPTRQILDSIYEPLRRPLERHKRLAQVNKGYNKEYNVGFARPQLIMSSATFRVPLRSYLADESGWFSGGVVKITGPTTRDPSPSTEDTALHSLGGTLIQHHALLVSPHGQITNIKGAVKSNSLDIETGGDRVVDTPAQTQDDRGTAAQEPSENCSNKVTVPRADSTHASDESSHEPPLFLPYMLEAISETFALDVPRLALLILPPAAPLQQTVSELRILGVDAKGLDVFHEDTGGAHLMKQSPSNLPEEDPNPTLLVSTLASIRGLDLPDLTHVFILGVPVDSPVDTYLHAAGRVGRFGRSGRVVTILAARHQVMNAKGKLVWRAEEQRMEAIFKKMRVTPVKLEHFE